MNSLARDIKEFIATFSSDRFPSPVSRTSEEIGNLRGSAQTVDSASPTVVSLTTMAPSVVSGTVEPQREFLQITDLDIDNIQLLTTSATLSTQSLPGTLTTTATDNCSSQPTVLDRRGLGSQPASTSMVTLDTPQHEREHSRSRLKKRNHRSSRHHKHRASRSPQPASKRAKKTDTVSTAVSGLPATVDSSGVWFSFCASGFQLDSYSSGFRKSSGSWFSSQSSVLCFFVYPSGSANSSGFYGFCGFHGLSSGSE